MPRTIRISRFILMCATLTPLVAGCGGQKGLPDMVPIRGSVSFNGKALTEGTVIYAPVGSEGRQARGTIQSDGTFQLTTLRADDGAQFGDYKIVVIALEPHPGEPPSRAEVEAAKRKIQRRSVIPDRYTSAATTDLTDMVNEDHAGVIEIVLED